MKTQVRRLNDGLERAPDKTGLASNGKRFIPACLKIVRSRQGGVNIRKRPRSTEARARGRHQRSFTSLTVMDLTLVDRHVCWPVVVAAPLTPPRARVTGPARQLLPSLAVEVFGAG